MLRTRCPLVVSRKMVHRRTAGIVVIGDEILKGSTVDTNSGFFAKRLHALGINTKKISVVGDLVDEIAIEIKEQSDRFDYVLTTGGVGPTHDDKTYEALAKAFNVSMEKSPQLIEALNKFFTNDPKSRQNQAVMDRLSTIPQNSELIWGFHPQTGEKSPFPIVKVNSVVAFPGVPHFCQKAFNWVQKQLFPASETIPRFSESLFTSQDEFKFSDSLAALASKYAPNVEIGSYPVLNNSYFKTKLIVESESQEMGIEAVNELKDLLAENMVHYDEEAWISTTSKMETFTLRQTDQTFVAKINEARKIIADIVEKYSLEEIALSFNGGKDCTLLLHLLRVEVDKKYGPGTKIQGFHIMCEDQFPEVSQFIIDVASRYNITVTEFPGPLKTGLGLLKRQKPLVTAVFMGSRASDPKGKYMKSPIEWTDSDWPRVLRVCPVLSWTYKDVWATLRGLCIPYCILYDQGYTSLGGRESTFRNPLLKTVGSDGKERYKPAFMLLNEETERDGRSSL